MTVTEYYWDELSDNVLMEADENGDPTAVYTNEPGLYGELISEERGGEESFYHFDGQGSTRELTDDTQAVTDEYTYTAFGQTVASSGGTVNARNYKGALGYYTNGDTDDIYVRTRTYDPGLSRWDSVDPLKFVDGSNNYTYVRNSPISAVDPAGMKLTLVDMSDLSLVVAVNKPNSAITGLTNFCYRVQGECELCDTLKCVSAPNAVGSGIMVPVFEFTRLGTVITDVTVRIQGYILLNTGFVGPLNRDQTVGHEQRHLYIAKQILRRPATKAKLVKLFPTGQCVFGRTIERCKADAINYQRSDEVKQAILGILAPAGRHRRADGVRPTPWGRPPVSGFGEITWKPWEFGRINLSGWVCFSAKELETAGQGR